MEKYPPPPPPQYQIPVGMPPAQHTPPPTSWFQNNQKNKPQSNSVGSAALIFMSGGMNIAWSCAFHFSDAIFINTVHLRISWFIAAIIGVLIGCFITNFLTKKIIMISSSGMIILSGILMVSLSDNYGGIVASRYINGIGVGFAFVPAIVMAGEEAVKSLRGMLASSIEAMSFSLGIYLQVIITISWTSDSYYSSFNSIQLVACLHIFYAALALVFAFILVVESPVYYMLRNDDQQAIDSLRRLQKPFVVTTETYEQFEQHKRYIAVNKEMSMNESAMQGLPALLKLCYYRALVGMSFTEIMSYGFQIAALIGAQDLIWPWIIYATLRWLGVLFAGFFLDNIGRKNIMLCGLLICGGLSIGLGVIYGDLYNLISEDKMTAAMAILFIYQFFAGVYSASTSAYLAEAYPLGVKNLYIAIPFIIQMIVLLITCAVNLTFYSFSDYFYALGVFTLVFFLLGIFIMPETKRKTLLEAQEEFRGWLSSRTNII